MKTSLNFTKNNFKKMFSSEGKITRKEVLHVYIFVYNQSKIM